MKFNISNIYESIEKLNFLYFKKGEEKLQDKFLDKFVKKNYNNELEIILEDKKFNEEAKNLLLSMLYKIEGAYKDYKTVKRDIETKDEYINKIINIIQYKCDSISVTKQNSINMMKNITFSIDKEKREIIVYPIEQKLLYAISKINQKDIIVKDKYDFLNKAISDVINIGNSINIVEVLRDFNGWSWSTLSREIESIEYNLIYQIIRILAGNELLNNWIECDEENNNYLELLKKNIKEKMRRKKC